MSVLGRLAEFVRTADARRLPKDERDILRRHVSDVMVARYAGARSIEGRALAALKGTSTAPADVIAGLAASVRLTEIDDIHIGSCTTASSVTVPVALGLAAAAEKADPARVMGAILAGTELVVRLAKAIDGANVLYQGIWPTRTAAPLGAAAVACRMWDLDDRKTAHALSLALMMTPSRMGRIGGSPSGRWVLFMAAVGDGIRAAQAAREGFSGDPNLIDGQWLEKMLGVPVDMGQMSAGLGQRSVYPELSLKPYCTSRQALSATEAMRRLLADGLNADDIISVRVAVPTAYAGMSSTRFDPSVRASSYVSAGAMMAIAALAPDQLWDVDRDAVLGDSRVKALADKVSVQADPALDALYPQQWPAEIAVETRSGIRSVRMTDPTGDPGNRLDDAGLASKIRAVLRRHGAEDRCEALMALGHEAMENEAACGRMARLFVDASLP